MFIHLHRVLTLVSIVAHTRWPKQLNTLTLGTGWSQSIPRSFCYSSRIACRAGFSTHLAGWQQCGVPCMGNTKSLAASVFRMKWSLQKSMHRPVHPQSLQQREMGLEEVMVSHVFKVSPVWSVPLPLDCQHWHPHTLNPLHEAFYPLSREEALGYVQMNACSLLFIHPRGVWPVWHWAGNRQFTPCGAFSVWLFSGVCSFRMVVVHMAHLACMII